MSSPQPSSAWQWELPNTLPGILIAAMRGDGAMDGVLGVPIELGTLNQGKDSSER